MSKRRRSSMLNRSAFDCSHVKSVSVMVLTHPDHPGIVGRIVANWSDNPNGSVCTATVHVWKGPLAFLPTTTGTAGGGGYDKLSAAICDSLWRLRASADHLDYGPEPETVAKCKDLDRLTFGGEGETGTSKWFGQFGYTVVTVVG